MNIIREDINAQSAVLKVQVSPADYEGKVKSALEKYRKNAKIPGFRAGKIPFSLIQKQYGKGVLVDELNNTVNTALQNYISENKIDILGNPIPQEGVDLVGDFDNPGDFVFTFELGLAPKIEISLSNKDTFEFVKVNVDEELIGKQIDDLRRRYGKLVSAEEISENELVLVQLTELNEDGSVKEGGVVNSTTISMEFVEDEATKKAFLGKKQGEEVVVDPKNISRGGNDTAAMLGLKEEDMSSVSNKFSAKITEIRKMELAELNTELYTKLFGEGVVNSEEELKTRIKTDLEGMFQNDSDRLLVRSVYEKLMEETKVEFPEAFLKRWIKLSSEKEITMEEIENQFEGYKNSLKWQLIQSEIFKVNNLQLKQDEVLDFTKNLLVAQYAQYGLPAPEDAQLAQTAIQVLGDKEESARIYDMIAESKLSEYFKATVTMKDKLISYDEFVAFANGAEA